MLWTTKHMQKTRHRCRAAMAAVVAATIYFSLIRLSRSRSQQLPNHTDRYSEAMLTFSYVLQRPSPCFGGCRYCHLPGPSPLAGLLSGTDKLDPRPSRVAGGALCWCRYVRQAHLSLPPQHLVVNAVTIHLATVMFQEGTVEMAFLGTAVGQKKQAPEGKMARIVSSKGDIKVESQLGKHRRTKCCTWLNIP